MEDLEIELPQLGADRMYLEDDNWQDIVIKLIRQAKLVLLYIDDSQGLLWELENTIKNIRPEKVILCIPQSTDSDKCDKEKYELFQKKYQSIFPNGMPENIGDAQFIYLTRIGLQIF